jgi:hypothetical protein
MEGTLPSLVFGGGRGGENLPKFQPEKYGFVLYKGFFMGGKMTQIHHILKEK